MTRARLTLYIAAALLSCLLLFPAAGLAVGSGAIAGNVEDANSHAPLEEIQACAYRASGFEFAGCDATDPSGDYSIQGLSAGSYKVQLSPSFSSGANYISQYYDGKGSWSDADVVTVAEAATTSSVDAAMQPGGQITGTVTDTVSDPIEDIEVCVHQSFAIGSITCAHTDAAGKYAISGLPSGSYVVKFSPDLLNYVTQYYDGRESEAEADSIGVVAGSKTSGIDAEMEEGGQLSGAVIDAVSEAPLPGVTVCAYRVGSGEAAFPCGFTDSNGKYTVSGLPSGSYKAKFIPEGFNPVYASQYYDGKPSLATAEAISVTTGTMATGIDAGLVKLGKIAGNVSEAGGPAIAGISVCASLTGPGSFLSRCGATDASGDYTISGLSAGSYLVVFEGGFDHVTQYYDGKAREGEAEMVAVSLAATTPGVDASVDKAGKVEGTVIDAVSKAALEGVEVCPVKPNGGNTAAPSHCASTDASGEYTIGGLASGSFKIHFSSPTTGPNQNYLDQYYSGRSVLADADGVTVSTGAVTSAIDAEMHSAGRITGRVTAAGSGLPFVGGWVCASRAKGHEVTGPNCGYTDAAGEYTISRLASGSYKVRFMPGLEGASYLSQYYSDKPTRKLADAIAVTAGSTTANVNASMRLGGKIAGTVTDAESEDPVRGVEVCAFAVGAEFSSLCSQTDSGGHYAVEPLKSGSYEVRFAPGYGYHLNYLGQYYDGKAGRGEANPVQVTAGSTTAGIDAEMASAGRISGRVIDAVSEDPAPSVQACAIDPGNEEAEYCDSTDASGEYTINGLPSGLYKVRFFPGGEFGFGSEDVNYNYATRYYDGKASEDEAEPVAVTAGSLTPDIDAEMEEGGQVSGKVIAAGSNVPIRYVQVCAFTASGFEYVTCSSTSVSGQYRLEGLSAGEYVVGFSAGFSGPEEQDNYLTQYYAGRSTPQSADPVTVTAGALRPDIDAEMHPGGQISGRVTDAAEGAPLPYVEVCALEAAGEEEALACAEANAGGEYVISGLPTGSYKVEFSAFSYEEEGPEEEFVTQFFPGKASVALATPVAVTAGALSGSIDAQMVEAGAPSGGGEGEGGGGSPGGGGQAPAGSPPVAVGPAPITAAPGRPAPRLPRCRKGFKRKKAHGKTRCVKVKHHR